MALAKTIHLGNKIIRSWAKNIDELSKEQLQALCQNEFITQPIYLMADAHAGYGVPIGTVLQTQDVVIPNAVGVDIGCGMTCTLFESEQTPDLQLLYDTIHQHKSKLLVPDHATLHSEQHLEVLTHLLEDHPQLPQEVLAKMETQLGTLGGGNHFIEVGQVEAHLNRYYVLVHSGSRGAGALLARHFNQVALALNKGWQSKYTPDLNFIHRSSAQFIHYFTALELMGKYAKANRTCLTQFVLSHLTNKSNQLLSKRIASPIDCSHNTASMYSSRDGHYYVVHHKGANSFSQGKYVVVAGTQGTPSYICTPGPASKSALGSCSHGAGRVYSRRKAKENLSLAQTLQQMEGIIHGIRTTNDLDEAPDAYKDIEEVIEQQAELIRPKYKLNPRMVFKE